MRVTGTGQGGTLARTRPARLATPVRTWAGRGGRAPGSGPRGQSIAHREITGLPGRTGGPRDLGIHASAPSRHQGPDGGRRARQPLFPRRLLPAAERHQDRRPGCRNARRAPADRHPRFPGRKAADHAAAAPASPSPDTTPPASRRAARPRKRPGATDQKRSAQPRVSTRSPHRRRHSPAHPHRPYQAPRVNSCRQAGQHALIAGLHNLGIRAIDEQSLPVAQGPVTDPFGLVSGDHEIHRGRLGMPR